ncbi:Bacterial phosphonate metabolism protein (PhnI) [Serratia rubidaea]|uniref:Bacterial phosphonate metabolism protein (PhnI) n=1 Tax=Serratia rubidaea TaxID=61652 RepID=A0A4U9H907_SERRU|nr:Bacterial phosphonate metabolism protein (PhnI) [Serratia rubidaea]
MTEGGVYDRELAALAIKQASGDLVEAIFLLRAYRTTLPRLAVSEPLLTEQMRLERRISAIYKDLPGGQLLGPTYDYTTDCWTLRCWQTATRPMPRRRAPTPRRKNPARTCSAC